MGRGFFLDFLSFIRFFVIFGCVVYVVYANSFFVVCPWALFNEALPPWATTSSHVMCSTITCSPGHFRVYGPQLICHTIIHSLLSLHSHFQSLFLKGFISYICIFLYFQSFYLILGVRASKDVFQSIRQTPIPKTKWKEYKKKVLNLIKYVYFLKKINYCI